MRVLVAGAGGFIGGHLVAGLLRRGYKVTAVDIKNMGRWHQLHHKADNWEQDASNYEAMKFLTKGQDEVYNLAADMGGMGFIEKHRVDCLRSVLINTNLIEAAYQAGVGRYFFASSACVYNTDLQTSPDAPALKESDALPAMAERGYGWEKLFSEMVCQEYWAERGMKTFIARFHNVYGPYGTYKGGREKAPAALCRKIAEVKKRQGTSVELWGDGEQTRSFMYIDDCIYGIERIMHDERLVGTPINLGSSELVSIHQLLEHVEEAANYHVREIGYDLSAPKGVNGRNSDNTFIKSILKWEPSTPLSIGIKLTYDWIEKEIG